MSNKPEGIDQGKNEKREFIKQYVLARASVAQGSFDGERCAMNADDIWKRIEAAAPLPKLVQ